MYVYVCMYVCMHVCMYVCMYVCIYIYICYYQDAGYYIILSGGGNHLSNTTCLTRVFFKSGEEWGRIR